MSREKEQKRRNISIYMRRMRSKPSHKMHLRGNYLSNIGYGSEGCSRHDLWYSVKICMRTT